MIKRAYSVSFLLSINIFVWQNVLYFPNDLRIFSHLFMLIVFWYRMQRDLLVHSSIWSDMGLPSGHVIIGTVCHKPSFLWDLNYINKLHGVTSPEYSNIQQYLSENL